MDNGRLNNITKLENFENFKSLAYCDLDSYFSMHYHYCHLFMQTFNNFVHCQWQKIFERDN
jgi:hypothetical protein